MKKIIALSILAVSFAVTSAFGQGYFQFTTGKSQVYDGFTTPGASALGSTMNVAFLWAPSGTATPMPISATPSSGNSSTTEPYTVAQAWAAIMSSSDNWTLALNAGNADSLASVLCAANGSVTYNGGVSFGVTGTSPSVTYSVFMIAWNGAYATPQAAQTAGSAVGWSSVFSYDSVTAIGTPGNFSAQAPSFGVFIPAAPVPEPSTLALAGLGGFGLLMALRRKKA